jgi:hypothetical protein
MLEIGHYLITDWRGAIGTEPTGHCVRDILHATTGAKVGSVRGSAGTDKGWLRWFRSYRLEIRETDDESLLLILKRPWRIFRLWDIHDADEQRIGSLYPPSLLDEDGVRRAFIEQDRLGKGRIVSIDGRILAETNCLDSHDLQLRFAAELEENPFLRMLLLASVIALDHLPTGA